MRIDGYFRLYSGNRKCDKAMQRLLCIFPKREVNWIRLSNNNKVLE